MTQVARHKPGDGTSSHSASVPSTTDGSSWSPAAADLMSSSTSTFYSDPSSSWSIYTPYVDPTSSFYSTPLSSPSPLPSTRYGPAAVPETSTFTRVSTLDGYLNTVSLSPLVSSTAAAKASLPASTNQTALIAALTTGIATLLLLLLLAFLLYRRRKQQTDHRQEPRFDSRALPLSALLHDDEMAHNSSIRTMPVSTVQHTAQNPATDGAAATIYRSGSPSPSMLRSRVSESGSIFREDVWPPPSPTVDPIQMQSSQVELSRIVDDVMGPATNQNTGNPTSDPKKGHKRGSTANSTTPLLIEPQTSFGHDYSDEDFPHAYASPSSLSPTSPLSPISPTSPVSPVSPPIVVEPREPAYGLGLETLPPVLRTSYSNGHSLRSSSSVSSLSSLHSAPGPASLPNIQSGPSSFRPPSRGSVQGSMSSSIFPRTQPKISSPLVDGVWNR